jgi:hypothetical protein
MHQLISLPRNGLEKVLACLASDQNNVSQVLPGQTFGPIGRQEHQERRLLGFHQVPET